MVDEGLLSHIREFYAHLDSIGLTPVQKKEVLMDFTGRPISEEVSDVWADFSEYFRVRTYLSSEDPDKWDEWHYQSATTAVWETIFQKEMDDMFAYPKESGDEETRKTLMQAFKEVVLSRRIDYSEAEREFEFSYD